MGHVAKRAWMEGKRIPHAGQDTRGGMAIALGTFAAPASSSSSDVTSFSDVARNPNPTPNTDVDTPLPWLRTWVQRETFPEGET